MRYIILVLLNLPVILLALVNIITQYKIRKVSKARFRHQIILWLVILVVLVCSFPLYNYLVNKPLFDSSALSLFDIVQTAALVFMFYVVNRQRQQIEQNEQMLHDLHREISIKLALQDKKKLASRLTK
jgi:hypothetical protein